MQLSHELSRVRAAFDEPNLMSLNNLADGLPEVGRREEALATTTRVG